MPVVRKASTANRVFIKKESSISSKKVSIQKAAANLDELGDVNVDPTAAEDGFVLIYDAPTDKFILVDPDVVLSASVDDNDLPDDFIAQVEDEIDLGNVQLENVDGGGFV